MRVCNGSTSKNLLILSFLYLFLRFVGFINAERFSLANDVTLPASPWRYEKRGIRGRFQDHTGRTNTTSEGQQEAFRKLQTYQDANCPTFNVDMDFFDSGLIGDAFAGWLTDDEGKSFLDTMIDDFLSDQLVGAKGKNIRDLDGVFSETCNRLPLDDETCYFVLNPETSFLDTLIANYIPFYQYIIEAKQFIGGAVNDATDTAEDIYNFVLPDKEPAGSCFAVNEDMIGIVDVPGIPPPWIYSVCNCISLRSSGVPACTVQPYFRGFAFATSNNALVYDISDRLGQDFFFYDGFTQYKFVPQGDIWASVDFGIKIPKLVSTFKVGDALQNAVCVPSEITGGEQGEFTPPSMPQFNIKTSLLIQNDLNAASDGELLILAAIEEMNFVVKKFFEISLGTALAVLRVRSANPECQPSGLYITAKLETNFGLGEGLREFVGSILPDPSLEVNYGVTWKDTGDPQPQDFLQSLFYRLRLTDFQFMGFPVSVEEVELEIQYFDDLEFARRRDWTEAKCCIGAISDCSIPNQPLLDFISNSEVEEKPTVGMFLSVQDLSFFFGVVKFESVQLNIIFQLALDGNESLSFLIDAKVTVLYIAQVGIRVSFLKTPSSTTAEFIAFANINVGLGTLSVSLEARASVGAYLYDPNRRDRNLLNNEESRALVETSGGESFLQADWDLDFNCDWQTAQWLKDLGAAIVAGLKAIADAIIFVWNKIVEFVGEAWNAIKDLAAAIGGAIAEVFDAIGEAIDEVQDAVAGGIDAAVGFLNGQGAIGEFAADILGILGDGVDFVLDKLGNVVDFAAGIFRGDWKAVGEAAAAFFGFSKSVSGKTEITVSGNDPILGCPQRRQKWEECKRAFGIKYDCKTKYSDIYPERSCAEEKAEQIEKLKEDAEFAQQQELCKEESRKRNQGLQYASEQVDEDLRAELDPTMASTRLNIGKTSALSFGSSCEALPFDISVNKLSEGAPGLSGRESKTGSSSECVDFSTADSLGTSLKTFQEEIANEATDLSRGNQGLDKDSAVGKCGELAGATCGSQPYFKELDGFKTEATVTCDINWNTFNFLEVFGETETIQDSACPDTKVQFKVLGTYDSIEDGCAPVEMRIERTVKDCCKQPVTNPITHTLYIESLPPTFTQTPGSMDMELACDENIHPMETGEPTYEPGCRNSVESLDFVDEYSELNLSTCRTTVTRTFTVTDNDCDALTESFVQKITLRNDYAPTWDYFPPDTTVGIFDAYGTEELGYPTVYQQCGASPIKITYTDSISEGDCFAERIVLRTFKAEDVCGHETERTQTIKITNSANSLPLGPKSLASVYGRNRARIANEDNVCLWAFDECDMLGAPTGYQCETANEDEFTVYQDFLWDLNQKSLNLGPTIKSCACGSGDASCDVIQQATDTGVYFVEDLYGVQVVNGAGTCTEEASMQGGTNTGTSSTLDFACPVIGPPGNSNRKVKDNGMSNNNRVFRNANQPLFCEEQLLQGSDQVYNIFQIDVDSIASRKIVIDSPPSSFVLVNVDSVPGQNITIEPTTVGVELANGLPVHNVLWNMPYGVNVKLASSKRAPYEFYGTLLNSQGEMLLTLSQQVDNIWKGQLFCENLNSNRINFECGHFAGFTSCS